MAKRKKKAEPKAEVEVVADAVVEPEAESETPLEGAEEAPKSTREADMELVVANRHRELNKQLEEHGSDQRVDIPGEIEDPVDTETNIASEEVVEDAPPAVKDVEKGEHDDLPVAEAPPETTPDAEGLVSITLDSGAVVQVPPSSIRSTIKVDGVQSDITLEELTRDHQKSLAGANRLNEAAQLKRDLESKYSEEQPPNTGVVPSAPSANADVQARVEKAVNALYSGDVEEATAALTGLVTAPAPAPVTPPPSVDAIARDVEARLEVKSAGKMFAKDFGDIAADPFLMHRADAFADEIANEDSSLTKLEIFQKAGEKTREWLAKSLGTPAETEEPAVETPTAPTSDMKTRREKKSASARTIPITGKIAGLGEPVKAQQTASDIISDMRKARGQAV